MDVRKYSIATSAMQEGGDQMNVLISPAIGISTPSVFFHTVSLSPCPFQNHSDGSRKHALGSPNQDLNQLDNNLDLSNADALMGMNESMSLPDMTPSNMFPLEIPSVP